jgi:effector-binding domain-containing protein
MPRVSDYQVIERGAQTVLSVRKTIKMEELTQTIGEVYGRMAARLKEKGEHLADTPYLVYHNMDMAALDIELCFPFAAPKPGDGFFAAGSAEAGKFVTCVYRGPYADIGPTYDEMMKWMADNGHVSADIWHEAYLNGPGEVGEDDYLTMIFARLK